MRRGTACRSVALLVSGLVLAGCTSSALNLAPASATTPTDRGPGNVPLNRPVSAAAPDFAVTPDPSMPIAIASPSIDAKHLYSLPELIDIAQLNNPVTRAAWQRARQAATAVGAAEAVYLPILSADVLAGYQRSSTTEPAIQGPIPVPAGTLTARGTEVIPSLTVKWLLFDFGQRDATLAAANQLSYAANVTFNGTHQKLIFDVSSAFFNLAAARSQVGIAEQTAGNAEAVVQAAQARVDRGVATAIELAQAKQQLAQARFGLTQSRGNERSAYVGLLQAVGIAPTLNVKVQDIGNRSLPRAVPQNIDRMIASSLQRRPDVQAAFARVQADRSGISAARAEFMPKIALAGDFNRNLGRLTLSDSRFDVTSKFNVNQTNANVMLGITMPIFDGGLRDARLQSAIAQAAASEQELAQLQSTAAREIVGSYDLLRTSLSAYAAASELTRAAQTTYDAALAYYKNGLGTLSDLSVAQTGLLQARLAKAKAYSDSLVAAATVAFATGTLTNRNVPSQF